MITKLPCPPAKIPLSSKLQPLPSASPPVNSNSAKLKITLNIVHKGTSAVSNTSDSLGKSQLTNGPGKVPSASTQPLAVANSTSQSLALANSHCGVPQLTSPVRSSSCVPLVAASPLASLGTSWSILSSSTSCESELRELMRQVDRMVLEKSREWLDEIRCLESQLVSKGKECALHLRTLADKAHELNSLREKILDCEHVQKDLMSEYEKQTARLRNELLELKDAHRRLQGKYNQCLQRLNERESQLGAKTQHDADRTLDFEELTRKSQQLQQERDLLSSQMHALQNERDALFDKLELSQETARKSQQLQQERDRLAYQLQLLQSERDAFLDKLEFSQKQASSSIGVAENERAKADTVSKERDMLDAELAASDEKLHHFAIFTKNLEAERNLYKECSEKSSFTVETLSKDKIDLERQLVALRSELADMKRQSAEAAEAMQVQWTALEENLQNSQSSHKQLELELARVSGELQTKTRLLEVQASQAASSQEVLQTLHYEMDLAKRSLRELKSEKKHLEEKAILLQRLNESSLLSSRSALSDASVQTDPPVPLVRLNRECQTETLQHESSVQRWARTSASALSTRAASVHSAQSQSQTRLMTSSAAASLIEWSREAPDSEDGARSTMTALSPVSVIRTPAAAHSDPVSSASTPSPTLSEPRVPLVAASTPSQQQQSELKKSVARNASPPVSNAARINTEAPPSNTSSSSFGQMFRLSFATSSSESTSPLEAGEHNLEGSVNASLSASLLVQQLSAAQTACVSAPVTATAGGPSSPLWQPPKSDAPTQHHLPIDEGTALKPSFSLGSLVDEDLSSVDAVVDRFMADEAARSAQLGAIMDNHIVALKCFDPASVC